MMCILNTFIMRYPYSFIWSVSMTLNSVSQMGLTVRSVCEWTLAGPLSDQRQRQISKRPASNTRRAADRDLGPMRAITRELLTLFYAPFNRKLAEVLQDESFTWDRLRTRLTDSSDHTRRVRWVWPVRACVRLTIHWIMKVAGSIFVNNEVFLDHTE